MTEFLTKEHLTKDEAKKFFFFLKKKLKVGKAAYARKIDLHPVTVSWQYRHGKVKRAQAKEFWKEFFKEMEFLND